MDINSVVDQTNNLYHLLHENNAEFYRIWAENVFLTWRWWISLSMIVVPWVIWIIVRRKESTDRLLYAGFFVMLVASYMDVVGIALELWSYPINVLPLMPEFIPFDISALPVATMLFLQFFPKINQYVKALAYSALASFVFQPLSSWLSLYKNINWEYYYSFPILFLIYLGAHYLFQRKKFNEIK